MSDNPYEPPQDSSRAVGVLSGQRADLRKVAMCQKGIIICILVYAGILFGQFAIPQQIRPLIGFLFIAVAIASFVFIFRLSMLVYGTGTGVLLGFLNCFPCIGLIVLLMINGKATSILMENGIRVGLLGAKLSDIDVRERDLLDDSVND